MITLKKLLKFEEEETLAGKFLPDVPNEVYHHPECPGISKSGLDQVHRSYDHYLAYKEKYDEPSRNLIIGSAVHDSILQPELFDKNYVVKPNIDRRTKVGKEQWAEFIKKNFGKEVLTKDETHTVEMIKRRVLSHPVASKMLAHSQREYSGWFMEEGALCKFRPDIYKPKQFIADIKTTEDASLNAFRRSIAKFSYDKQAAFYQAGIKAITGDEVPFYFIAVEKTPPYGIAIYKASESMLEVGRELYKNDLKKYINAMIFGDETGYPEGIQTLDLPAWGTNVWER